MNLFIDLELQTVIPPLVAEDHARREANLPTDGCGDPTGRTGRRVAPAPLLKPERAPPYGCMGPSDHREPRLSGGRRLAHERCTSDRLG
jgi:hypothetical protein